MRPTQAPDPSRRAALVVLACWMVPGGFGGLVVLGVLALAGLGTAATAAGAALAFALAGAAGAGWSWWGADRRAAAALGGRPADPTSEARLFNLVEGLCDGAGLRPPQLRVLEDPALNAAAAGRHSSSAVLLVTSGLLAELTRVELEGALAAEVVRIRRGDVRAATVATALGPIAALLAAPPGVELWADTAAVALTRYPPGLAGALEKMLAKGAALDRPPRAGEHLWLADPRGGTAAWTRVPLEERVEALQEL